MPQPKIATCSYCGTRAALILDRGRHELACASCGAPLHDLKMLKTEAVDHAPHRPKPGRGPRPGGPEAAMAPWMASPEGRKVKKKKKRKGLAARFFDEAFDAIEDLFD
ncbi:hypothetical protein [Thetidibacter halocola]|uniref:Uncharacterized protein n=1 Tax=Thetidibacter halocola TaxID=2827239 RepID=A0A8J7WKF5_9RHOB|nr:hypothetical protein [Thetidibacter halocola]MBS0126654.1 hypothetical protein [Thetidibacter halocola]